MNQRDTEKLEDLGYVMKVTYGPEQAVMVCLEVYDDEYKTCIKFYCN
jgi:hypothetical protein